VLAYFRPETSPEIAATFRRASSRMGVTGAWAHAAANRTTAATPAAGSPTRICSAPAIRSARADVSRGFLARGAGAALILFLGERAAELAVAVEHHFGIAVLQRTGDVHAAATAHFGFGLEQARTVLGGLEMALGPAFLLEAAFDLVAFDRDVDGHLVGRTLGTARDVGAGAGPAIGRGLGGSRADEQKSGQCTGQCNSQHFQKSPLEKVPDCPEHRLRLFLSDRMAGLGDGRKLRFRYRLFEGMAIDRRDQEIFPSPHHQDVWGGPGKTPRQNAIRGGDKEPGRPSRAAADSEPKEVHRIAVA